MMKRIPIILCAISLVACAPPHAEGPNPGHGFQTAGIGIGQLMLSPLMIAAGLVEGIASLPFFLSAGVHELNQGLVQANASMTLDDTYRAAYGERLSDVPASGDTGRVFTEMRSATVFFQSMLNRYGVKDANRYVLTAIRTADADGYTLYAVVRRDSETVQVADKLDPTRLRTLTPVDLDYYRPYFQDTSGQRLDHVVDWAGISRRHIQTQKGQAILMNLAANSILNDKRSDDYWQAERRWMVGGFREIASAREVALRRRMGLG